MVHLLLGFVHIHLLQSASAHSSDMSLFTTVVTVFVLEPTHACGVAFLATTRAGCEPTSRLWWTVSSLSLYLIHRLCLDADRLLGRLHFTQTSTRRFDALSDLNGALVHQFSLS